MPGYCLGSGGGGTGTDVSDSTAVAADVRPSKYFYLSNGVLTQGTMTEKSGATITPVPAGSTITKNQYLTGDQVIPAEPNLVAAKIKQGESIFGVTGTFTSDANAVAADIKTGKTAYSNGVKYTGTFTADADAVAADIAVGKIAYVNGEQVVGTYEITAQTSIPASDDGSDGDIVFVY